jgi:predicted nucleic acid-binding protein
MRIFLDANILFSASFARSLLADFLGELKKHATLITNAYAKTEAERNVSAKIPKRLPACQEFADTLELVPIELLDLDVKLAEKDRPILCGAIIAQADYLLTGDKKDFGHLFGRTIRGVKIVSVQLLLADLIKQGIIKKS